MYIGLHTGEIPVCTSVYILRNWHEITYTYTLSGAFDMYSFHDTNAGRKATSKSREDRCFLSERTTDEELFTWQLKASERQLATSEQFDMEFKFD